MTRFSFFLILAVFSFSCNQSDTKTETQTQTNQPAEVAAQTDAETPVTPSTEPEDLTPDVMTKLPAKIDGCSALFTYDSVAVKKGRYVFVHNRQGLAMLQIDGQTLELQLAETTKLPDNQIQEIFSTNQHKVILITRPVKKSGDETTTVTGTLEILKDVSQRKFKVKGEVGC